MRRLKKLTTLCLMLFVATGCPEDATHGDDRLTFINNSMQDVNIVFGYNYPDTALLDASFYTSWYVESKSRENIWSGTDWGDRIRRANPHSTLMLFVIDADLSADYDWEKIREEYIILKRYDLSIDDLRSRNWKVYYP